MLVQPKVFDFKAFNIGFSAWFFWYFRQSIHVEASAKTVRLTKMHAQQLDLRAGQDLPFVGLNQEAYSNWQKLFYQLLSRFYPVKTLALLLQMLPPGEQIQISELYQHIFSAKLRCSETPAQSGTTCPRPYRQCGTHPPKTPCWWQFSGLLSTASNSDGIAARLAATRHATLGDP